MSLYDTYVNLDLEEINEFIDVNQEENLTLEFKTLVTSNFTNSSDKKNLAKALSGFANSSGGIVIWGIRAEKNEDEIDCAVEIKDIDNPKVGLTRLNELTGMAVSPIVDDVQHRIIETKDNKGVLVSYIPESSAGPHMAKLGDDRYYKRSGDSFYRMEHFDLEDMFGRRPKPDLEFYTRVKGKGPGIQIVIGIKNVGKGGAKAPYIAFNPPRPFIRNQFGLDGNGNEGMKRLPYMGTDLQCRYGEGADIVIHPGVTHEVGTIWLGLNPKPEIVPKGEILIEYEIAAEGFRLTRKKESINIDK